MPRTPSHRALEALTGSRWASVPEMIAARVRATPDTPFLAKGERAWSYAEGWQEALRFAGLLAAEGLAGERVASFLPKAPEVLFAWFGGNALGGSFLALDRQQKGDILAGIVERGRAPVLVTDRAGFAEMPPAARACFRLVVFADEPPGPAPAGQRWRGWSAVAAAAPAEPVGVGFDRPTVLIFTSGTTGRPKPVVVPHAMYTRGAAVMVDAFGYHAGDVFHDWMPLSHVGGQLHVTLCAICAGARLVMFERFSRHSFWQEVRAIGATVCGGFSNVIYLLSLPPPSPQDRQHRLRMGMIANNTPKAMADFEARFGLQVIDTYGMSECEPLTLPLFGERAPPGSCGRINPDFEVAIVDSASDLPLPAGAVGRILVRPRVPHVMMQGYEDDAAATVAVWQNLWFHSQDLGRLDEHGFLYFVDRMKNAIRRGGENVAAVEVERVLKTHPEVADCGVVGVDDPVVGQEVKAVIVPAPGTAPAPAALRAFALERMAAYMAPRYIELRDKLEYSEVGKVRRETLGPAVAPVWDARGG